MKKFLKLSILSISLLAVVLVATGCGKSAKTAEEFKSYMVKEGFTVTDTTAEIGTDIVKKAYLADNGKFMIEFYQAVSVAEAKNGFTSYKNSFAQYEDSDAVIKNSQSNNAERYTLLGQGYYTLISRIDDTMIYTDSPDTYKEDIIKIAKDLGY